MIFVLNSLVNPDKGLTPHTPGEGLVAFFFYAMARLSLLLPERSTVLWIKGLRPGGSPFFIHHAHWSQLLRAFRTSQV